MQSVLTWLSVHWLLVAAIAAALIFVANAITRHWSTQTGLVRVLTFIAEILSPLTSKDVPGVLKLPLTSKPPDAVRKLPPLPVLATLAALLLLAGCASWQAPTKTAVDAISAAAESTHAGVRAWYDPDCEAAARQCGLAGATSCPAKDTCQQARHRWVLGLSSVQLLCIEAYGAIAAAQKDTAAAKLEAARQMLNDLVTGLRAAKVIP